MMDNEECWVLMGEKGRLGWTGRYDRYTTGHPAQVAFDPDYVWENRDRIIGWIHTHPHWRGSPSSTDDATMKAQVCALGRPMLCCIIGTDKLRAWWYMDDEPYTRAIEVPVLRIRQKLFGLNPRAKVEHAR